MQVTVLKAEQDRLKAQTQELRQALESARAVSYEADAAAAQTAAEVHSKGCTARLFALHPPSHLLCGSINTHEWKTKSSACYGLTSVLWPAQIINEQHPFV